MTLSESRANAVRHLTLLGAVVVLSLAVPAFHEANPEWLSRLIGPDHGGDPEPAASVTPAALHDASPAGRRVSLPMDTRGHFVAEFTVNGRRIDAMVDTGATLVAVNRSTARRMGVSLSSGDFRHPVATANGSTMAAGIVLDRVEIGRIAVENVPAVVLDDEALSSTLIGMSFLKRLARFEVADGMLFLEQ